MKLQTFFLLLHCALEATGFHIMVINDEYWTRIGFQTVMSQIMLTGTASKNRVFR